MRHLLRSAVVILLVAGFSQAQTFRGAINGTVVDPSGAVVAGAEVRAINNGTGVTSSRPRQPARASLRFRICRWAPTRSR